MYFVNLRYYLKLCMILLKCLKKVISTNSLSKTENLFNQGLYVSATFGSLTNMKTRRSMRNSKTTADKTPVKEEINKIENGENGKLENVYSGGKESFTSDSISDSNLLNKNDKDEPFWNIVSMDVDQNTVNEEPNYLDNKVESNIPVPDFEQEPPAKKQKLKDNVVTPLSKLNEYYPGLAFDIKKIGGGVHNPIFQASVELNYEVYTAEGGSKKIAKQLVAAKVLENTQDDWSPCFQPPPYYKLFDFTSDDPSNIPPQMPPLRDYGEDNNMVLDADQSDVPVTVQEIPILNGIGNKNKKRKSSTKKLKVDDSDRNPVMVLNEKISGLKYEFDYSDVKQGNFKAKVVVNGNTYEGTARNKKGAKSVAAAAALRNEFGVKCKTTPDKMAIGGTNSSEQFTDAGVLPDFVMDKVLAKFSDLTQNLTIPEAKRKVIAGIVMTRENGPDVKDGKVVSLATGTKCITGGHISNQGTVLNDCHAEIISRRGLKRYLCKQLHLLLSGVPGDNIFESTNKRFRIRSDVFFHLFINTAPCGDGRIFSPHESEDQSDKHPNRISRGQLRTKIESGEGTIPVPDDMSLTNGVQPWDSIVGGERLLTMSCSDKIARWNVLGVQGGLLSTIIEPIYLSSIILGSLYHSQHLKRAMYDRISESLSAIKKQKNNNEIIIPPFKLHRPLLAVVANPEQRVASKAPNFCTHWTDGDEQLTIIEMAKGKTRSGESSNLCKREMLINFLQLPRKPEFLDEKNLSYASIKLEAKNYQNLKKQLYESFKLSGMGIWVQKPEEVDQFNV